MFLFSLPPISPAEFGSAGRAPAAAIPMRPSQDLPGSASAESLSEKVSSSPPASAPTYWPPALIARWIS